MEQPWPVYIVTKGRAGKVRWPSEVEAVTLVVEPQDEEAYRAAYPTARLALLPGNNGGIARARNGALEAGIKDGHEWIWMLDDDLHALSIRPGGAKLQPVTFRQALLFAQRYADPPDLAQLGTEMRHVAWGPSPPYQDITSCFACVAFNLPRLGGIRYTPETWEDTDMALQVISSGLRNRKVKWVAYHTDPIGAKPGGLYDTYHSEDQEWRRRWTANTCRRWPGIVRPDTSPNTMPLKVNYNALRKARKGQGVEQW